MAGICLIVGVEALGGLGEQLVAQIVAVLAAICYAGAAIFGRSFKGLDPMAPAAGSLLCGAAILIPLSLVVDRPWTLAPSASSMLALLVLAVFSTALAFVIYFRLVQTLGSVGTTAQAYLRVPIGVAVGVVFLGESLTATAWIGLACVVIGVAAMTIPARKAAVARGSGPIGLVRMTQARCELSCTSPRLRGEVGSHRRCDPGEGLPRVRMRGKSSSRPSKSELCCLAPASGEKEKNVTLYARNQSTSAWSWS